MLRDLLGCTELRKYRLNNGRKHAIFVDSQSEKSGMVSVPLIDKAFFLVLIVRHVVVYVVYGKVKEKYCLNSLLSALASMVT